jgi:hypothetical protein
MNAVMPRCAGKDWFVRASTTQNPPTDPCVMNILLPLSNQSSPSLTAVVRRPALSEPDPGSVSAHAASHSPVHARVRYFCFCASLPTARMCPVPRPL